MSAGKSDRKNANYTPYQQKIIQRYYDNREQIDDQRLSELVANIYLASAPKRKKLWESARELMLRLGVPESRIDHVVKTADPALLAEVVKDLQSGKITRQPPVAPKPEQKTE